MDSLGLGLNLSEPPSVHCALGVVDLASARTAVDDSLSQPARTRLNSHVHLICQL